MTGVAVCMPRPGGGGGGGAPQVTNESSVDFQNVKLELHRLISMQSSGSGLYEADETLAEATAQGEPASGQWLAAALQSATCSASPSVHTPVRVRRRQARGEADGRGHAAAVAAPARRPAVHSTGRAGAVRVPAAHQAQGQERAAEGVGRGTLRAPQRCQSPQRPTLCVQGGSFTSEPTVKLPIAIYAAVPAYTGFTQPPPGWSPAVSVWRTAALLCRVSC